ncbi:MAG: apolipoprotein N-acyltransferase [Myxococcota bacterium]|nr:apolipoprotein N-acyltransferase [Myxococcota bacterium]MDW8362088.1 apolipoprotein N-acyltransferase [Myxococcales bacterium]
MTRPAARSARRAERSGREPPTQGTDARARSPSLLPSLGLGALSAVAYFCAFPGIGLWPLGVVALVPLLFAVDREMRIAADAPARRTRRRLAAVGVLFGTLTNAGGYYWLVGMLEDFSGFPLALCVLFALLVCAYQGGLLALLVAVLARARVRGAPSALALPAAFVSLEWLYPLLFPSYYGAIFHDVLPVVQIVELGGPLALTALAGLVNATVYETLRAWRSRNALPRRLLAGCGLAVGATLGFGLWRIDAVDTRSAASPSMWVGVVQASLGKHDKWDDPVEGHRRHVLDTLALENEGPLDLVVWPESALSYVVPEGERDLRRRVLGPIRTAAVWGGLRRAREADGTWLYNTAFLTDAEGRLLGHYDKTYLLMFGEYLPLGETFPVLYDWSPQSGRFRPGRSVQPLSFGDWKLAVFICYEAILPGYVRRFFERDEPNLLVNLTNDSWFGDTTEPWQHLALARLRAVEHRRWLVRSTNTGVSAIVDPVGRIVAHTGVFTRERLRARVHRMQGRTPYAVAGDVLGWLALAVTIVAVVMPRRGVAWLLALPRRLSRRWQASTRSGA